tara:strand:- start:10685 stop:10921 length:237 start_codon:yes stop_codon:yes gene_type:complete
MTPLVFAVLLALAIAFLTLGLFVESVAFAVASASIFLIIAGSLFVTGLGLLSPLYNNILSVIFLLVGIYIPYQSIGEA